MNSVVEGRGCWVFEYKLGVNDDAKYMPLTD